jgi:hypothetical protein
MGLNRAMSRRFTTRGMPLPPFDATSRQNRVVSRRCRVCEWQENRIEAWDADPDCPWCHAPTVASPLKNVSTTAAPAPQKNPHAAALGRLGGLKGGRARAATLSAKERREIAVRAARARWKKP